MHKKKWMERIMINQENIDYKTLKSLATLAAETKSEINIELTPERTTINIAPWKPFEYQCPYRGN